MSYSKEKLSKIRQKMIDLEGYAYDFSRRDMCISELIRFATDPEIMGFEDPKSRADDILRSLTGGSGRVSCWREGCSYIALYNSGNLSVDDEQGTCGTDKFCTKDAWYIKPDLLDETSVVVRNTEQIAFICVRATCDFNCGYTFGGSGSFSDCAKETIITAEPSE